eukprot:SAG31_NODE_7007_length_1821_cov_14.757840_2_plen_190_part_00
MPFRASSSCPTGSICTHQFSFATTLWRHVMRLRTCNMALAQTCDRTNATCGNILFRGQAAQFHTPNLQIQSAAHAALKHKGGVASIVMLARPPRRQSRGNRSEMNVAVQRNPASASSGSDPSSPCCADRAAARRRHIQCQRDAKPFVRTAGHMPPGLMLSTARTLAAASIASAVHQREYQASRGSELVR